MKKLTLIISLLLVAGFVISCGKTVEPVKTDNKPVDQIARETDKKADEKKPENQREFEEAAEQPLLWTTYEEFVKIEKSLPASDSLAKFSTIKKLWKTIETERVSWGQNPFPVLTQDAITEVNQSYIVNPAGVQTQFALNALLYRGAKLEDIDALHMLKDNPEAFAKKFTEIYLK